MKIKYLLKVVFTIALATIVTNCAYNEDVIEELSIEREFAPVDFTARVRNQTSVELNWAVDENANHYVVEFSADDPNFTVIFESVQVTADQLPILIRLEGETLYAIRVKAVSSRGLGDSSWAISEAQTLSEQIMLPYELGDAGAREVILRWEAGLNVTHFILQPGDVRHDITAQEKADGVATVTGLTPETEYMVTLFNNNKVRGTATITTGVAVGDNTLITPADDLFQTIADAQPGDIILLEQGDYTAQIGTITLNKSITIRGLSTDFKPFLKIGFSIDSGADDVKLIDLDLTGDSPSGLQDVVSYSSVGNYSSLLIRGCNIHDYDRSFVRGNTTGSILESLQIENCIVTNILTGGGDFIDFRNSDVLNVNVNTSTFNNCAPGRDFFRLDDAGASTQTGLTCNVILDSCTIYACSNSDSRRLMYVRFQMNKITVTNTLITDTESEGYSDQSRTDPNPTFNNNNYFNAQGFYNTSQTVYDGSATFTTLDPGFVNAASGNFTVTNQTLLDNQVGDPRWRQ